MALTEKHSLMGLDVVIIKDDSIVNHFQQGLANFSLELPITNVTKYRIASISKSITAAAVLKAAFDHDVSLDADISQWLGYQIRNPHFPAKPITINMLLNHTSSLVDGEGYGRYLDDLYKPSINMRELISTNGMYYTDDLYLDQLPGSFFTYSNIGYAILGLLLEEITATRFDLYTQQYLFEPLSMDASFNDISLLSQPSRLATIYRGKGNQWTAQVDSSKNIKFWKGLEDYKPGDNALLFGPQGSLRCSALDLCKFLQLIMNNGILNNDTILVPEIVEEMQSISWQYDGNNGNSYDNLMQAWGKGMHISSGRKVEDLIFKDLEMIGHPGEAYGLISGMYFSKARRIGFIYITNGSKKPFTYGKTSSFYRLEEELFDLIFNFQNSL